MSFYKWSQVAAANATADTSINFAEGQAPSSLNDSCRAMMKVLKDWGQDISGTITTGGASTAFTVTSSQVFDSLANMAGAMIAFVPHTTSGATVTLNVDGLGAKPLRSAPSVELPSGVLVQGTPYVVTYNNSDGAFYLQGFTINPYQTPIGGLMPYLGSTAPNSSFVLPYGQAISRTTYATLFTLVSTIFGAGDGSTTFNVPDLRGRSIYGLDNMGGSTASRITVAGGNFDGTVIGNTGGAQNHTIAVSEMPAHAHAGSSLTDPGHTHGPPGGAANFWGSAGTTSFTVSGPGGSAANAFGATASSTTGMSLNIASQGGGAAHTVLNPAIILPYILRVI